LIDAIRDLVQRRIDQAGSDPDARLFTGPRGGRITTATLYEHLKRHSLRHTGLWMADAGVPVHVLRKIAGHADLSTTQRYLHPDRQSVAGAGELLSKHLLSQNGPKLRIV
jgi:integrase